ncbi:hypothetical protein [Leifsonia sp. Leaf264]|nr:hypothetical protein [Leifsonia sp. Leaf264]
MSPMFRKENHGHSAAILRASELDFGWSTLTAGYDQPKPAGQVVPM